MVSAGRFASAANGTWSTTAGSGAWQTTTNWLSGIVPGATSGTTNTDTALFNSASSTTTPTPDLNRNLENITFDTSAVGYTIGSIPGNALLLTSGGTIQIASTFTGSNIVETLNAPLTLEGNYTLANNATNTGNLLNLNSAITSGVAGTQTLTVSGNDAVFIDGAIAGGTGTIALAKNGNNTLTLGGSGDNTGLALTVNSGTVVLAKSSSASVHAVGSGGLVIEGSGVVQLSGTGGDQISDSATVTIQNAGVLTLAGHNETIGGLSGGFSTPPSKMPPQRPRRSRSIARMAPRMTFPAFCRTARGAALSLVKSGNGEQALTGDNTFTGAVTINAGTLDVGNNALNPPNAVAFGPGSTGTLSLDGTALSTNSFSISGLSGSSPNAVILNGGSNATLTVIESGSETFAGMLEGLAFVKAGAGSLLLSGNNNFSSTTDIGLSVGVTVNAGTLTLSGTNSIGGGVTVNAGILTLNGNNSLTGGVTISAGTLQIGNPGTLNSAAPNVVTDNGTLTLNGNSVTVASLSGSGIVQNANAARATLTVAVSNGGSASFAGTLQDGSGGGTLSLVVNGSGNGEQNLSGVNTFTGGVTVNNGTSFT